MPDARPLNPLAGGGEMGELMRAIDWSRTAVGPVESWPQSLRTALSILLETGFPMYIAWGPEFTQFYNDGYRPILGSTKHPSAMGISTRATFAEIWPIIGPMFEQVMAGKEVSVTDFLLPLDRHGFAEECYFIFSYSPIREESGAVGGVLVTVTETTQRVLAARRLQTLQAVSSETQQAASVEAACEASMSALAKNIADVPFALLYLVDDRGKAHLACASGADVPPTFPAAVDVSSNAAPSLWREALASGAPRLVELPEGGPAQQALVLPIAPSAVSGLAGLLVAGLSPRLRLDEAYRSFLGLVAAQIGTGIARVRSLEEAKARAEALAELDRAKTAFFSNVSHEFRTPLTLMLGPTNDALASPERQLAGPELEMVHRNQLRLLKLVNTLLDFARIEAGRQQACYEPVDLARITRDLASVFRSTVERAGLRYDLEIAEPGEPVYVDREMWEKIVLNLLSNAFKFTLEGGIGVRLGRVGDSVELAVSDTGIGVAPHEQPRLFERFHRVAGARGRTHEGTGIGLALVQELVKLHGGSVRVDSELGAGSTFRVSVPLGSAHLPPERIAAGRTLASTAIGAAPFVEEAARWLPDGAAGAPIHSQPARHEPPVDAPAGASGDARILVVDDNADMRDYLRRLLAPSFTVETAPDGAAALAVARAQVPDLVLTDVMMPQLDGFGLLRELRADARTRSVPVVLLSARAGEESKVEGLAAGADDYLVKPFSARELLARIRTHLDLSRLRAGAEVVDRIGRLLASELDRDRIVQLLVDEARQLVGAEIGAFFHNVTDEQGDRYTLYALSGAAPDRFAEFPMPRKTALFGPTFEGTGVVRIDDVTRDERYGRTPPHHGMPEGHLPVRSYLAVPVKSRAGEVLGGLFFGHASPGVFSARSERLLESVAAHAAIALDNARLFDDARRAKAQAEVERARLRTLLMQAPVAVAVFRGPRFVYELANARYETLVGRTGLVGKALVDEFPEVVGQPVLDLLRRVFETGVAYETPEHEVTFDRGGGHPERGYFAFNLAPLREADGSISGVLNVAVDVTEQVRARTGIEQARQEAEAASRAKDEFLAILGHELRNPLAPILTGLQLMALRGDRASERERDVIERQVNHVVRLVDDLLDVSRITRGKVELKRHPVELAEVVAKGIEMASPLIEERRQRLSVDVPSAGLVVHGDLLRLAQVVSNLLTNAAKYSEPASAITVVAAANGNEAVLRVRDEGIGLPAEMLTRVFDLFVQEPQSMERSRGGLGLGLTIVRSLVEQHGGSVQARSAGPGRGSEFIVRLPVVLPSSEGTARRGEKAPATDERTRPGHAILVVDDNRDAADLLADTLRLLGHRVAVAYDAPSALALARAFVPEIGLLDVGLPVMDGYELARRLREIPGLAGMRLIAITGYAQDSDRRRAKDAGFDEHHGKPIQMDRLMASIASLASDRRGS